MVAAREDAINRGEHDLRAVDFLCKPARPRASGHESTIAKRLETWRRRRAFARLQKARRAGGATGILRARVFFTRRTTACSGRMRGNSGPGPGHFNHPLSTASQVERRVPVARGARASIPAVAGAGSFAARLPSVWPGAGPSWSSRPRHFAPDHRSAPAIQAAARA